MVFCPQMYAALFLLPVVVRTMRDRSHTFDPGHSLCTVSYLGSGFMKP